MKDFSVVSATCLRLEEELRAVEAKLAVAVEALNHLVNRSNALTAAFIKHNLGYPMDAAHGSCFTLASLKRKTSSPRSPR